tara:strand:- start:345 stop:521 length:177 start_codon:yes stop_codon:yes gene_type:complete
MIIILTKEFITGQGITLKPGDKLDCNRATYERILSDDGCEPLEGYKPKKKTKKDTKKK